MTLGIAEFVWILFPGDNSGSGLRGVVWVIDISYPLVFVGHPIGTKILGMLLTSNFGV